MAAKKVNWIELLEKYKWSLGLGAIGLTLLFSGLYSYLFSSKDKTIVEIIPIEEEVTEKIWVDIEGAIEKSGVYELAGGSRVNDLLIKAGGLAVDADRDWVEKNINLAQKLSDGVKIYIPRQNETGPSSTVLGTVTTQININTASASELDSLWGIGKARADNIIAGRPYQSIEELRSKKIVPNNVYERIEDKITVY